MLYDNTGFPTASFGNLMEHVQHSHILMFITGHAKEDPPFFCSTSSEHSDSHEGYSVLSHSNRISLAGCVGEPCTTSVNINMIGY